MISFDLVVVGAGPAGCLAALSAPEDMSVLLVDRLKLPRDVICGGVVHTDVFKRLDSLNPPDAMMSEPRVLHWSLYDWTLARGGPFTDRTYLNVDRAAFDAWLLEAARARDNLKLWPSTSFAGLQDMGKGSMNLLLKRGDKEIEVGAKNLIGADGCASAVRRALGVSPPLRWMTVQETMLSQGEAVDRFLAFIGGRIEHYGWVIPKGSNLLVGIGCSLNGHVPHDSLRYFTDGLMRYHGIHGTPAAAPRARMVTRLRSTKDLCMGSGRVLLAGEASGLICPWSGEGISYAVRSGLMAGRALASRTPLRTYQLYLKQLLPSIYFDLLGRRSMKRPWARKLIALGAPGVDFTPFGLAPDQPADGS